MTKCPRCSRETVPCDKPYCPNQFSRPMSDGTVWTPPDGEFCGGKLDGARFEAELEYRPRILKSGERVCELVDDHSTASIYDCEAECCGQSCSRCKSYVIGELGPYDDELPPGVYP